jgi:hypothetical protein
MQAGLPSWPKLIEPLIDGLGLTGLCDLALAAEYYEQNTAGGRPRLEEHLAKELSSVTVPSEGHKLVTTLGVSELWTPNFDPLLETSDPAFTVVNIDDDASAIATGNRVIIKMHGGFSLDGSGTPHWKGRPVITRGDFERYSVEHPRLWAALQASYLTRTMLFLGFSFTDPNIELLLGLARRQGTSSGNHHLAVLRRPTDAAEVIEHNLRVKDLELNGVAVCEIADFDDLVPLLRSLKRRTRPSCLFVAGSGDDIGPWCDEMGAAIAEHLSWDVASLGGDAGWLTTRRVGIQRRATDQYDPSALRLYFRSKPGEPPPPLTERVGTAVFSHHDRHPLVDEVMEGCRAMLLIGGGNRTTEEVDLALELGLGVVPIAASGGAALAAWEAATAAGADSRRLLVGGRTADSAIWAQLGSSDVYLARQAATTLLEQAMYSS